jgi:hypothetical protein
MQFELESSRGAIEVSGTDGSAIDVRIVRTVSAGTDQAAREALALLTIGETVSEQTVRITTRAPSRGPRAGFRGLQLSVQHHVRLPRGSVASFKSEGGGVTLKDVNGRLTVSAVNGGIMATGLTGALTASLVNGGMQIQMAAVPEPVDLTVVSGGIRLQLPRNVMATIVASAVNGGVSVSDALKFSPEPGSEPGSGPVRRVKGTLNGGGPTIMAQATNGGVRIEADESGPAR